MKLLLCVLLLAVAMVCADTRSYNTREEEFTVPQYEFQWGVKDDNSGNLFNQIESRNDDVTRGAYYVALPDGRLQKVTYYVDGDSGFVAEVTYEDAATWQ